MTIDPQEIGKRLREQRETTKTETSSLNEQLALIDVKIDEYDELINKIEKLSGKIVDVQVDPQDFDIKRIISTTIEGGNGSGTILEPVLNERRRELSFDARLLTDSGGIDHVNETLTFLQEHNIASGEPLVYDRNNNIPLGIGTVGNDAGTSVVGLGTTTLINAATYYPLVINPTKVKLFQSLDDYNAGINTVGFATFGLPIVGNYSWGA